MAPAHDVRATRQRPVFSAEARENAIRIWPNIQRGGNVGTAMPAKHSVAIYGGGVGGLSAAHELAERGFAVTVYERHAAFGGKARSLSVAGSGVGGRGDLPGEHGFRFFPGFYKHVTDTMRRIPFGTKGGTCRDNLVQATRILLARQGKLDPIWVARFPETLDDFRTAFSHFSTISTFRITR
jgi:uncharacterized protein with NAD-binding domain and iron-sulfur cluster